MSVEGMIGAVIEREGGYVDHPADRGGPTCWGITRAVALANGYDGPVRCLSRGAAAEIYRRVYWERPGYAQVAARAPGVAAALFDAAVNMGSAAATEFLQRALNALNRGAADFADIARDGLVGPATLAALDAFLARRGAAGEGVLVKAIEALRGARYVALAERRPANEAFLYGWLANRIGS